MIGDYKDNKDNVELIIELSFSFFYDWLTYFKPCHLSVKHVVQSVLWGREVDPGYGVKWGSYCFLFSFKNILSAFNFTF